jgi:hypothetical protein
MTVIVNPGSRINPSLPNSYERAQQYARKWLDQMRAEGISDIELIDNREFSDGRWRFRFRHLITGVTVNLDQHGLSDNDDKSIFPTRVYWNGSSSANPSIEDFAAPGYVMTYRRVDL